MPNKKDNLQDAANEGAQIIGSITDGNGTKKKMTVTEQLAAKGLYRFNLILPLKYKDYLQAAAYYASSPTRQISITKYIEGLIDDDIKRSKGDPKNARKFSDK